MRASSFVFARFRSFDDNQQQQQQWQLLLLPLLLLLLSRRLWAASVETVWEITCDICSVAAGDQAAYSLSRCCLPSQGGGNLQQQQQQLLHIAMHDSGTQLAPPPSLSLSLALPRSFIHWPRYMAAIWRQFRLGCGGSVGDNLLKK